LKPPTILYSKKYFQKFNNLNNYDKLNLAQTQRDFEKSIQRMRINGFQTKEVRITCRVVYTTMNLDVFYDTKRNEIIIIDIV